MRFDSTKRRWRETTKHYDPQAGGLVVVKVDQSGKQRSRVVSDKALQRWQRRFGKARSRTGSQRIRQRGDHSWTWLATPHVSNPYAIGQVKALGKRGLLQRSSSGYVSELGARFGWVNERHAPGKPRQSTNKQVKERGSGLPYSIAGQPAASSGAAGGGASNRARRRLADTVTTIEQLDRASLGAHGIKQINVRVGPDLDRNAGGDINPSNKHKPIRIHPGVAQGSSGLQAFVIGHELGHQKDSKKTFDRRNRAMAVTNAWSAAGLWLPATRAWLRSASLNRSLERTADRSAGRILAKGHATGKTSWTPAAHFPKRAKGQPRRQFSPLDGYDKGPDRARTSWRAFRRTRTR